jgi:hypothetical protein
VKVQDTTAPAITGAVDLTVEATGPNGAVVTYQIGAQDIVDGPLVPTVTPPSGSTFPVGKTTVTGVVCDSHGNQGTATFTVTVQDTTAPAITVPASVTQEATGPNGAVVTFAVSANDLVDGAVTATATPASGSVFPLGATEVVVTAIDAAGNSVKRCFTVTVQDTTGPVITVPGPVTVEATGPNGAAATFIVSAADAVDGAVTPTANPPSGSVLPVGTTTVTVTAVDKAGNPSQKTFQVSVKDSTAPVITVPANITAAATGIDGAVVNFTTSAEDLVDGPLPTTATPPSGSTFKPGATEVVVTAMDSHGNKCTKSFLVTVGFSWSDLLQPINTNGTSVFKQGSTIPVKFNLTGASAGITNGAFKLYAAKVSNGIAGTELEAISTSAADTGNTFRYDASARQYIFNLSTKSLTDGTYQIRVDLGDGVSHITLISLKK